MTGDARVPLVRVLTVTHGLLLLMLLCSLVLCKQERSEVERLQRELDAANKGQVEKLISLTKCMEERDRARQQGAGVRH